MSDEKKKKPKKQRDGLYLRNGIWWFRRVVNGKREAVSTHCKDRNLAKRRATEIEKDQNDGIFGWKKKPEVVVPTIAEYVKTAHAAYYRHQLHGARMLVKHERLVAAFPGKRLNELNPTDCQGFLNGLGLAQNTIRDLHIGCTSLYNRAIEDGLIVKNPWSFPMVGEVPRMRVMSPEEEARLFPALPPSARRAATVARYAGLRNWELCHIERGDVDWMHQVIRVRAEITKGRIGKKKARIVPLTNESAAAIREQLDALDTGNLGSQFVTFRDGDQRIFPYARTSLAAVFGDVVRALRMPRLTIHDLRRTFATRLAEVKYPIRKVQMWLGHADLKTTEKFYTHVDEHDMSDLEAVMVQQREALAKATPAKVLPMVKKAVSE